MVVFCVISFTQGFHCRSTRLDISHTYLQNKRKCRGSWCIINIFFKDYIGNIQMYVSVWYRDRTGNNKYYCSSSLSPTTEIEKINVTSFLIHLYNYYINHLINKKKKTLYLFRKQIQLYLRVWPPLTPLPLVCRKTVQQKNGPMLGTTRVEMLTNSDSIFKCFQVFCNVSKINKTKQQFKQHAGDSKRLGYNLQSLINKTHIFIPWEQVRCQKSVHMCITRR